MKRFLWPTIILILVFGAGVLLTRSYYTRQQVDPNEQSHMLLEQIRKVAKLVTVEGQFVEYVEYTDPNLPLWIFPMGINWSSLFPRSARLRVHGTVMVGYDLSNIQLDAYPDEKRIVLRGLPAASIISVEHRVEYFDRENSIFRPYTDEDIVKMTQGAADRVRKAAEHSTLMEAAAEQGNDLINMMRFMVENAGWTLEVAYGPDNLWQD